MDIEGLKSLLSRWGRWAVRSESRALGFPSTSPMFRAVKCDSGAYGREYDPGYCPSDIIDCDRAINMLNPGTRQIVVTHYKRGGSMRATARALGINHMAVVRDLTAAHLFIVAALTRRSDRPMIAQSQAIAT